MHLNVAVNKYAYMLIVDVYYRKAATRTRPRLLARGTVL